MRESTKAFSLICTIAAACTIATGFLPTNAYQRWQLMAGTEFNNLTYVYERANFDQRPIDVVILGNSKSALGVDVKRVRSELKARGQNIGVENFSVMAAGRNKDYAIFKEILKVKRPKLVIISVDSEANPYGHPIFKYFADTEDILMPPAFGLHNYLYDLSYLPYRQFKLFFANLLPSQFGLTKDFNVEAYQKRAAFDFTDGFIFHGEWLDMKRRAPYSVLDSGRWRPVKESRPEKILRHLNAGDDHVYIDAIAQLAKRRGIKILFLYLPQFGAPSHTREASFLNRYGPIIEMGDLSKRANLYRDSYHFNIYGATLVSDNLAGVIVGEEIFK